MNKTDKKNRERERNDREERRRKGTDGWYNDIAS